MLYQWLAKTGENQNKERGAIKMDDVLIMFEAKGDSIAIKVMGKDSNVTAGLLILIHRMAEEKGIKAIELLRELMSYEKTLAELN